MAASQFHARYFIIGDRVMVNGLPWDRISYVELNQRMAEFTAQGKLVGHFPEPFYGDLKVYELQAP
jgi:hypothetical protein